MYRLITLAAVAVLAAAGCVSPTGASGRAIVEQSGTVSGGRQVSLSGAYRPEWSALDTSARGCHFIATLDTAAPMRIETDVGASAAAHGAAASLSTPPGNYALYISSGCGNWSVRFVPI